MSLTAAQEQAIAARGNVLVVAGAGTGKTSTLVERCLNCLLEPKPPTSLDEILIVTFTEAAAAEMRQRIRGRLEQELNRNPADARWQEQLALFETAHLGTLHSFCLKLVRQHFYQLELDPQFSVLAEEEARTLAEETLSALLQKHYAGGTKTAEAVQRLIQAQGRGWDQPIRTLVLRLHHYTQTLDNPAGWLNAQLTLFASPKPTLWQDLLKSGVAQWRERWLPQLESGSAQNQLAGTCAAILKDLQASAATASVAIVIQKILAAAKDCPRGKKTEWHKPLEGFLNDATFLFSLVSAEGGTDPLAEDWDWVRHQMATLLELTREFSDIFTEAKRELGVVDFHDLEQNALSLLWDQPRERPSRIAQQWREQLRFVFVDEYQDINAAQDKIIQALSREGAQANRFLVGDVKQSIYRFRLANPAIFQGYVQSWGNGQGRVVPLVDNFRSREGLLQFVNSVFSALMQGQLGGLTYDDQARLRFGAREKRRALSAEVQTDPCVELHLRLTHVAGPDQPEADSAEALASLADLEEADKEARLVALRLRELRAQQYPIWDETKSAFRPVDWSDMAILLRAPANKSESYAKEFSRLNVPLRVARGGFYQNLEISDLLSLLKVLDNPLQDWPVLAVLHSPLVGLTLDELATIRLTAAKAPFWTALVRWADANASSSAAPSPNSDGQAAISGFHGPKGKPAASESRDTKHGTRSTPPDPRPPTPPPAPRPPSLETFRKVSTFLDRYGRWRRLARQVSLSQCLESVLAETHYADWLLTQPRGDQRYAQVQRLLALAQKFDQFQRQGLFRFLRFVDAQQEAETEPEVAPVNEENSVRLMSIHQSKGLEFPVVAVADLGKRFNLGDLRADVILDEQYGLCPQIKPPHTGQSYPSLPYWLARGRQHQELLGEELRLLYVAMTRARDRLILSASISQSRFTNAWQMKPPLSGALLLSARSYADWLGAWFAQQPGEIGAEAGSGQNALLSWVLHEDGHLIEPASAESTGELTESFEATPEVWQRLRQRLAWEYPFLSATRQAAKTSVTQLRRRAVEKDEETSAWQAAKARSARGKERGEATAADMGTAHHEFLRLVSLERVDSVAELQAEAERLVTESSLTPDQAVLLDFEDLAAFWRSDLGRQAREQADSVQRELAFTARFSPNELASLSGESFESALEQEFVVVQGVADLVVMRPGDLWVIDFKTDRVEMEKLAEHAKSYEPQLKLYARALARIYQKRVSGCWLYFLKPRAAVAVNHD